MSFHILYQEDGGSFPGNLGNISHYLDAFAAQLGMKELGINPHSLHEVAAALARPDFPHKEGLAKANPFKKAANFFVYFVSSRPIIGDLPPEIVTKELMAIDNYQNAVLAYHMAVDCLHKAELRKNGETCVLEHKIKVSAHFFHDFIETFACAVPAYHFKPLSLLFEQLCYKANPKAPYPEVV